MAPEDVRAAFLLKAGYPVDSVKQLLRPIIERFDEPAEVRDRLRAIEDTISKYEAEPKSVAGEKGLKDLLPEHAAALMAKLSDWLQLRPGAGTELPVIDTCDRLWGEIHDQVALPVGQSVRSVCFGVVARHELGA